MTLQIFRVAGALAHPEFQKLVIGGTAPVHDDHLHLGGDAAAKLVFYAALRGLDEPFEVIDSPFERALARRIGRLFGVLDEAEAAALLPLLSLRAQAEVRAAGRVRARIGDGPGRVDVAQDRVLWAGFFETVQSDLTHGRFDGTDSAQVTRAGFETGDAVTVLPYDPIRDRVMVVQQFRYGPCLRGDPHPWTIEPIAGRIDLGESTDDCARREAIEEAGLTLGDLHLVSGFYPTGGAVSEYITSYVGIADLPDEAAGLGGAADEDEDIRAHLIDWDVFIDILDSGEGETGPLIMSGYWLARHRERLRREAGGA